MSRGRRGRILSPSTPIMMIIPHDNHVPIKVEGVYDWHGVGARTVEASAGQC